MARKANGAAIRHIRLALGIPQYKFAERIGVKPSTMSQVESGKYGLHPAKLRRAADALGVPLDAISTAVPEPEEAA
jgi:transcriptional regulator with XRE-family HTH domain